MGIPGAIELQFDRENDKETPRCVILVLAHEKYAQCPQTGGNVILNQWLKRTRWTMCFILIHTSGQHIHIPLPSVCMNLGGNLSHIKIFMSHKYIKVIITRRA